MKKIVTLFYILFITATAYAQNTFAPAGSEWYHDMSVAGYGVFHSYYAGDTTIQGIPCRRVKQEAHENPYFSLMGLTVHNNLDLFFYNNADTVFIYDILVNRFTPIYVFNVNEGDTVTLRNYSGTPGLSDSTYSFIVDSVKTVLYDTAHLKTIYTSMLGNTIYSHGGGYAEQIGALNSLWQCISCMELLDDEYQSESALRCYSSPTMSVKLTQGDCDLYPLSVASVQQTQASIYPNPARDAITITRSDTKPLTCKLINMAGQIVINTVATTANTTLNTATLPAGIYLLQTITADGSTGYHKIAIE